MAPSITLILSVAFLAYMAHSMWVIYGIFYPAPCIGKGKCLQPFLSQNKVLEMKVFTSVKNQPGREQSMDLIWHKAKFAYKEKMEETINVTLPRQTLKNGTLYVHVFVFPHGETIFSSMASVASAPITAFNVPRATVINLLSDSSSGQSKGKKGDRQDLPVTHWRSKLSIGVMEDLIAFDRMQVPAEIYRHLRITPQGEYLPVVYIDELSFRLRDLMPVNSSVKEMPLAITYSPVSVGKLRMWTNIQESFKMLNTLGFTEKDTDEVKGIFADTNFYLLMLTFGVAAVHLLFDFLAFKNDIMYWKKRTTMEGLSTRAVLWRSVSTFIIFLYLMDEDTSLLVLIPAGIGTIIEFWKVKKALKVTVNWEGWRPVFEFGKETERELETKAFDSQAVKYLSYLLYPLCLGGAVYSLLYVEHKSWYSWSLQSLVNGVYAFGFLFMLPQLFVNYKLKSVAHLPWRAFMYKAFNTFIDDIFAFIITMPTAHRLACFRDDVVFLIYLYQRWLYPVDWTRVNEYGQSFKDGQGEGTKAIQPEETKKTK